LIGRHVGDVSLLAEPLGITVPSPSGRTRPRIGVVREIGPVPMSDEVALAYERSIDRLKMEGSCMVIEPEFFDGLFACFAGIVLSEASLFHFGRSDERTVATLYSRETADRLERAKGIAIGKYARWQNVRRQFAAALARLMEKVDFLVLPASPCVAPKIGQAAITIGGWSGSVREALMTYTAPFNLAGVPAISIPMLAQEGSLPTGMQIVARSGDDGALLAFAAAVEKTLVLERGGLAQ
jgi:aspartyl-tRNA(Asn)/glutamyl-tRNA(Gln) amidotransferase subunit A